jgi:hypothetical protein
LNNGVTEMQLLIGRYCFGYANESWNSLWPNTTKLKFLFVALRKVTKEREREREREREKKINSGSSVRISFSRKVKF